MISQFQKNKFKYFGEHPAYDKFIKDSHEQIIKELKHVVYFQREKEVEILSRIFDIFQKIINLKDQDLYQIHVLSLAFKHEFEVFKDLVQFISINI